MKGARQSKIPKTIKPVPRGGSPTKNISRVKSPLKNENKGPPSRPTMYHPKKTTIPTIKNSARLVPMDKLEVYPEPPVKSVKKPKAKPVNETQKPEEKGSQIEKFPPISSAKFHTVYMEKIKICKQLVKFDDILAEKDKITEKLTALAQLLLLIAEEDFNPHMLSDEEQEELMDMIKTNIFRPINEIKPQALFCEIPPLLQEPMWPHLDVVYLILSHLHQCFPSFGLFTEDFANRMFQLFNTTDSNERIEIVKFFTVHIVRHPSDQPAYFKKITNILELHSVEPRPFAVYTSLLVLGRLFEFNEFKSDNYHYISAHILNLLSDKYSFYYHIPLEGILEPFYKSNSANAILFLNQLLKHWPTANTNKQTSFIFLLIEVLPFLSPNDLQEKLPSVFKKFAESSQSPNPRIADISFTIWLNDDLEDIIRGNTELIFSIMVPAVFKVLNTHWEQSIRDDAMISLDLMKSMDSQLVNKIISQVDLENSEVPQDDQDQFESWSSIIDTATNNDDLDGELLKEKLSHHYHRY